MGRVRTSAAVFLFSSLATALTGCGGGRALQPHASSGWGDAKRSAPSQGESASAPSAAAPSSESRAQADDRPGLGTEWGERRVSRVRNVDFTRADDEPFATATLRYNDERGATSMAVGYSGHARRVPASVFAGGLTVSVVNDNGNPFPALRTAAATIVMGREGERYSIVLRNGSSHRVEAVATVDGLDVINGRPGSFSNRGYLVNPHASVEIDGFRRSERDVAAFRFGRVADSYAASKGDTRDVGVIGVAMFAEEGDALESEDLRLRESASPFPTERYASPPR